MPIAIGIASLSIGFLIGYTIALRIPQTPTVTDPFLTDAAPDESYSVHSSTQQQIEEDNKLEELKHVVLRLFESLTSAIDDMQLDSRSYEENLEVQKNSIQQSMSLNEIKELGDTLLQHVSDMYHSNTLYRNQLNAANELVKHQQSQLAELQVKVGTDFLTNTHNRAALHEHLRVMINISRRYGNMFCLVILDIDHFKVVNDTHGHLAGDAVLRDIAKILKTSSRDSDFLARYGGEEFVYILPEMSGDQALQMAQKLLKQVEDFGFSYGDEDISVTMSGGISVVRPEEDDRDSLFNRADQALFKAKKGGRNQVLLES
jgi:diguanylate cyclase